MEGREITPPLSTPQSSVTGTPESWFSFDDIAGSVFTPRLATVAGGNLTDWFEIEKNEAVRELQEWVNRYNQCFRLLKDAVTAVGLLREENLQLDAENLELEFLIKEREREERAATGLVAGFSPAGAQSASIWEKLGKRIGGGGGRRSGSDLDSPGGSGSGSGSGFGSGVELSSGSGSGSDGSRGCGVPKSISIRSRGFLALNQPPAGEAHRLRLPLSPALHGGEKESGEVEVEVYKQGTAKTELCNKWGEMGWCPYADHCRFAHGIEELRPVIRHPRFKTQLCRMLGAGDDCPYGHRCHFRHAQPTTGTPN